MKTQIERIAVTPAEAAEMIGCAESFIYKLNARGALPFKKVGRLRKIPIASVRALIEGETA